MSILDDIKAFFAELQISAGKNQTHVERAGTAFGHALLGNAIVFVLPSIVISPYAIPAIVTVMYFLLKEMQDIRKGGSRKDSVIDTGFVGLGAFTSGMESAGVIYLIAGAIDGIIGRHIR